MTPSGRSSGAGCTLRIREGSHVARRPVTARAPEAQFEGRLGGQLGALLACAFWLSSCSLRARTQPGTEARMRLLILSSLAVTMLLLALGGCGSTEPGYTVHKLPSGREVKVLGMTKMFFAKGDSALVLKYRTALKLDDHEQLRKEVEEVWQAFRGDVEREGLKAAVISVQETPKRVLIMTKSRGYNFVVKKSDAGAWEFLDGGAQTKQAG